MVTSPASNPAFSLRHITTGVSRRPMSIFTAGIHSLAPPKNHVSFHRQTTLKATRRNYEGQSNNGNEKNLKFLTSDDLGPVDRRFYKALDGYEEDIESMAANYRPEDFEQDDYIDENELAQTVWQETPSEQHDNWTDLESIGDLNLQESSRTVERIVTSTPASNVSENEFYDIQNDPLSPLGFLNSPTLDSLPIDDVQSSETAEFAGQKLDPPGDEDTIHDSSSEDLSFIWEDADDDIAEVGKFGRADPATSTPGVATEASSDELRSKFFFADDDEIAFPAPGTEKISNHEQEQPTQFRMPMTESSRGQDELFKLETQLQQVEKGIFALNNNESFNIASYSQVSTVLFGIPTESTNKSILEGLAFSSSHPKKQMAAFILEHRSCKQRINKLKKLRQSRKVQQEKIAANSVSGGSNISGSSTTARADPLMLLDASSFIFRAYFSMPPMHRADGLPVSAVLGVCNMWNRLALNKMIEAGNGSDDQIPPRLILCGDAPGKNFRHALYTDYKGNRPEVPVDLIPQFDLIKEGAKAYGIPWVEAPGFEADDVIATLAKKATENGLDVRIYSGDKDLMQLITDVNDTDVNDTDVNDDSTQDLGSTCGTITMIDPVTMTEWDHETVVEKWGVGANRLGDVLALAGDKADNVPGVPGIGPKIAAQLLTEFGSLSEIYQNLSSIKQVKRREKLEAYEAQAFLSRDLVELERGLEWSQMEITQQLETAVGNLRSGKELVVDIRMDFMDADRMIQFYNAMGFITIKEHLLTRLERQSEVSYTEASVGKRKKKGLSFSKMTQSSTPRPEDYEDVPF